MVPYPLTSAHKQTGPDTIFIPVLECWLLCVCICAERIKGVNGEAYSCSLAHTKREGMNALRHLRTSRLMQMSAMKLLHVTQQTVLQSKVAKMLPAAERVSVTTIHHNRDIPSK